uniref:Alpha/beta hydrolase fold protein n=1 Tax=Cyanothece sp. (strain PCC 7425 / ATCC 29141) TaxID=395961 RepID=B8HNQ0_CYAP4
MYALELESYLTANQAEQPGELAIDRNACLAMGLVAIPFSAFLISVALGQACIKDFYVWITLACLVASSPFIWGTQQVLNEQFAHILKLDFVNRSEIKKLKICPFQQAQTPRNITGSSIVSTDLDQPYFEQPKQYWLWRDWRISYTHVAHPQSSIPIILLHGFGGSIGHWRHNIPALGAHHQVYALDLLGFGASEKPVTPYSIQLWAEQVYEFWRDFIRVPAVLVGNSIGSLTCLTIANHHPEMVRGVAMISLPDQLNQQPSAPWLDSLRAMLTSPLILQPLFHLIRHPCIVKHWAKLAYARREAITDELVEILTAPARDKNAALAFVSMLKSMLSPRFSPQVRPLLQSLAIPSLLLWGQQDRMIPLSLGRHLAACNPILRLIELENAGHCAHDECPDRVNWELLHWIETKILPDKSARKQR